MELVELYKLFLMLYLGAVTNVSSVNPKCKYYDRSVSCNDLKMSDYPLLLTQSNSTFNLTLTNTENLPNYAINGTQIEKLVIRESYITSIAENAFTGHEDTLKVLHISTSAKQVQAPTQSLENLYNLEELQISNFVLNIYFNHMNFANLTRLRVLHLEDNSLRFFEKPVFKGLSALTNLIINKNEFTNIPLPSIFGDLINLTKLDMSDNKIQKITGYILSKSKNLKQLILKQNAIAEIERDAFKGLEQSLEVLDLKLNKLNHTQLINMEDMHSIRDLDLQSNKIKALPNGIFKNFRFLQVLDLKYNGLSTVKNGSLQGLTRLKTLRLDSNTAMEAGTLSDTPQLQEISFKTQKQRLLQMEWLQDAASLLKLYLDGNTFNKTSLWLAIQSLPKLEYLSLKACHLGYIPDFAFEQNRRLQTLKLDNNGLQVLKQETFQGLQESLISIDLESNNLQTVDKCVFQHFNLSLEQWTFPINLYKNHLVCNCSLLWLQEWIQIYSMHIQFASLPQLWKCAGSNEFIYQANLTCDSNSTNQTCQDFNDRYTTTMSPTTTTYYTTVDETTAFSSTLLMTTTFVISTTEKTTTTTTIPPTTTTTIPPPTTTTIPPTTTQPPEIPSLFLFLEKLTSSSISISWNISSWKHVQRSTLIINKVIEDVAITEDKIFLSENDPTTKTLNNLLKGTILNVCIQLRLDFTTKLKETCDIIRLLEPQKVKGDNVGIKIGIGIGVAILVTLILSLLGLMCYSRRKSKSSTNKRESEASPSEPKMTPKTKRYQKQKKPNNEPQVSVISVEPFQPMPRISAGSYQYLADPNLASNSTEPPQDPQPGYHDNRAFTESIHDGDVPKKTEKDQPGCHDNRAFTESIHDGDVPRKTEKDQPGYDNRAFIESIHDDDVPQKTEKNQPGYYDNKAFTESIHNSNVPKETEKNNNRNKLTTERPLPGLPGSQSFMQYFQPEEPVYVNVEEHYTVIPHTETTI